MCLLLDAIVLAHEFEDGSGSGVADAWLSEAKNSGIPTVSIGELRGDLLEEYSHGRFVFDVPNDSAPGSDPRGPGGPPLFPSFQFPARLSSLPYNHRRRVQFVRDSPCPQEWL